MINTYKNNNIKNNELQVRRGEVWWADLGEGFGSEQGGLRPVVIIQNDVGNIHSPTTIIAPVTTKPKKRMKTHVELNSFQSGLPRYSTVLLEQPRVLDKSRLTEKSGYVNMEEIEEAMMVSFGIPIFRRNKNRNFNRDFNRGNTFYPVAQ